MIKLNEAENCSCKLLHSPQITVQDKIPNRHHCKQFKLKKELKTDSRKVKVKRNVLDENGLLLIHCKGEI